jgi:hypothetical protein
MTGRSGGRDARSIPPGPRRGGEEAEVPVTATVVVATDDGPGGGPSLVDSLVGRLHAEYGGDPEEIRRLATDVVAAFAGARVQVFVPILAEKRLREAYRDRSGGARDGRPARRAVAGRRRR